MVLLFIVFLFIVFLLLEGSCFLIYDKFISKKDEKFMIEHLKQNQLELNPFSGGTILCLDFDNFEYIDTIDMSILCNYHINNMGLVLRGSELHYLIKQQFKQAK